MKSLTIDLSNYFDDWKDYANTGLSCPVLTVPGYFASNIKTVNNGKAINKAKINGVWFHVHCSDSSTLKVGEYRVPSYIGTGTTKVAKVMTSKEMSDILATIANSELANMHKYAKSLNDWLLKRPDRHPEHLIHVINGACWHIDEPRAYYTIPNWEVVLKMCPNVISFDITNDVFKKRYIRIEKKEED